MDRLMRLYTTKRNVIAITIATNYWIQYHRRDGQSLQSVANNESNGDYLLRRAQLNLQPIPQQPNTRVFSDQWFVPFVSIKPYHRMSEGEPGVGTEAFHLGSGFIAHPNGFVLTCFAIDHQIDSQFWVRLGDGRHVKGRQVFTISAMDIAVIKLNNTARIGNHWPTPQYQTPYSLNIDDTVYSVGTSRCPLHNQLTEGTVFHTAVPGNRVQQIAVRQRVMPSITAQFFVQHTALINTEDRGPALVNAAGEVVAVTFLTMEATDHLAYPVNGPIFSYLWEIMNKYAEPQYLPLLGLIVFWLDRELRQTLQKDPQYRDRLPTDQNGVLIWAVAQEFTQIFPGLESFNVITHINGLPVKSIHDMYRAVRTVKCGHSVTFSVNTENNTIIIDPKLLTNITFNTRFF